MTLRVWEAAQRAAALAAVVLLSPALLIVAAAVKLSSGSPVLYRAVRVGEGRPFTCYKFRTMATARLGSEDVGITAADDLRVTRLGRVLRRFKVDELPQLWNVLRGEMLLVGPRPEDPRYVDLSDPDHARVFGARPGITGPTALDFVDEEDLLAREANSLAAAEGRSRATPADVELIYRERILPTKVASDLTYLSSRSVRGDLRILRRTIQLVAGRRRHAA